MSISNCVRGCLEAFRIDYDEDSHLQDELGRFKVWVGNIAAHRPAHSRRSLEYRLRDSSRLRDTLLSLLGDLKTALDDLKALVRPHKAGDSLADQTITTALPQEANTKSPETYVHADHEDEDKFELSDEESVNEGTPVSEAIGEIHDVITCLLRFSMTLRSPGRGDQRKNDQGNLAEAFVAHDTEHVRAKFPEAPDYLVRRLGKTLSKHRQYFRYRREHQAKLLEGLDDGETAAWEMPSTIATSLPDDPLSTRNSLHLPTDAETESNYTATSYEGTLTGDATLRVPRWPVSAQTGSPFECPICFGIVVAETELSWKRHVFEDLPPYVCVSEDCGTAVKSFSRRRDWKLHNDGTHARVWVCPYGCVEPMRSPDTFRSHIETAHTHSAPGDVTQTLIAACGRTIDKVPIRTCPLCTKLCPSAKHWTKHVGHHLEQLALFSLPMELFTIDASDGEQKELEEAVAENAPNYDPDMEKAGIKFKDAVGRKFTFPWHLCKTWKGMENLIKQAFLHVDIIGPRVLQGHYDLMGPDGEIILPQVWDDMIIPGWEVSMHMWPWPETSKNGAEVYADQYKKLPGEDLRDLSFGDLTITKKPPPTGSHQQERAGISRELVDEPGIKPKRKKKLSGFAAWMAGQDPKSNNR
jgi:hypothetical protein